METGNVIEIQNLSKSFGSFQALNELNLGVQQGEVHGFLGPNGAGKSTTIRVLLGLLRADSGTVRMLGGDPWTDVVALHRRLAYVPGDVSLWPSMTGGEAIDLLGSLRGDLDRKRRDELLERFKLDPTKRGRQYSKGNRQKVAIIAALASNVELLILDEPTNGFDPLMESVFQDVILETKARGTSILLSSHILSEVENLADRLSIIREGQIIRTGTLAEMQGHATTTIHATLDRIPQAADLHGLINIRLDGRHLKASTDVDHIGNAMELLAPYGLTALKVEPPTLESLFLHLYETDNDQVNAR